MPSKFRAVVFLFCLFLSVSSSLAVIRKLANPVSLDGRALDVQLMHHSSGSTFAIVCVEDNGIKVVDVSDPSDPEITGNLSHSTGYQYTHTFIRGDTVYCVKSNQDSYYYKFLINSSGAVVTPGTYLGSCDLVGEDMFVRGSHIYRFADWIGTSSTPPGLEVYPCNSVNSLDLEEGFYRGAQKVSFNDQNIVSIRNSGSSNEFLWREWVDGWRPVSIDYESQSGNFWDVKLVGSTIYTIGSNESFRGVRAYEYSSTGSTFTNLHNESTSDFPRALDWDRNCLYVADVSGLSMFDAQNPSNIETLGRFSVEEIPLITCTVSTIESGSSVHGEYILCADSNYSNSTYDYNLGIYQPLIPIVFYPNGGDELDCNHSYNVSWNGFTDDEEEYVKISLMCDDLELRLNNSTLNDGEEGVNFNVWWDSEYAKIKIKNLATNLVDVSDNYFTISATTPPTEIPADIYVGSPIIVGDGDTLRIRAAASLKFFDEGKITVQSGGVLEFTGRTSSDSVDALASLVNFESSMSSSYAIEVATGGKVIGKHARFEDLATAIKNNGGIVTLDSAEFVNCTEAITMNTGKTTVSNSRFSHGSTAVKADYPGVFELTSCVFDSQTVRAVKLYEATNALIDHCTFNGLRTYGTTSSNGVDAERCSTGVRIANSTIQNCQIGVNVVLSNICIDTCDIQNNAVFGVSWSNNHPTSTTARGRINTCSFSDNYGLGGDYGAGFYAYACSPQVTCCTFNEPYSWAVNLQGSPTPWFYNKSEETVRANSFYYSTSTTGWPAVLLLDNAAPLFGYNKNNFYPDDASDIVMVDFSDTVLTHYVHENYYDYSSLGIDNFYPNVSSNWYYSPISSVGDCTGDSIAEIQEIEEMQMLQQGNSFAEAGNYSAAMSSYSSALALSGDTTEVAAAAIAGMAVIDPVLPEVAPALERTAQYCATYTYDALGSFTTSDSIRSVILSRQNELDSTRVEYDLAISELLRPGTMSTGPQAELARERASARRAVAFKKMLSARKLPKFNNKQLGSTDALPIAFALRPIYPNPFNPIANVRFDLPEASPVKVAVYDAMGRQVASLVDRNLSAGYHSVSWNGTGSASGVYFVTIHAGKFTATKKAILLK